MMKPRVMILGLVTVLVLAGCTSGQAPASGGEAGATGTQAPAAQENVIWASGKLLPARWAALSPATGGTVKALYPAEGDQVDAGTLLAEIDTGILQSQVEVAAAAVAEAEAARANLLAGAAPADLAAAAADVSAAQGAVAQAQAAFKHAQASVAAAEAQVTIAQAQYNELASGPTTAERVAAQRPVEQARIAVKQAQAAYDLVHGDPNIGARPEAAALEQATAALDSAQAAYNAAVQGATPQQLAVARAQVGAAKTQVTVTQGEVPAAEAGVQTAQAQAARAQAVLDRLRAGATAEEIGMADARVKSAEAALASARAALAQTQVIAPFAGQVGAVYLRTGELATPGQPVLALGDTGIMRVETTDLRETDVARLAVGMPVEVTFDALPGQTFRGAVARIAPMSSAEKGSTNYTVIIDVTDLDPALRWGMTAFVNIRVDK
jgi:multidrug efflux pump subunit AcrA (membrane-fusion protein)